MNTTVSLIQQYVDTGIIQFGRFQRPDGTFQPFSLNFLLLPSFTKTMQQTAQALVPSLHKTGANRLLTTRASIPLGAVLAVESGVSMTYPHGKEQAHTNAYVIEGAYDVGHPTTLLAYVLTNQDDISKFIEPAQKVGLVVQDILCIFSLTKQTLDGVRIHPLLDLRVALETLEANKVLTSSMREHVATWLDDNS